MLLWNWSFVAGLCGCRRRCFLDREVVVCGIKKDGVVVRVNLAL